MSLQPIKQGSDSRRNWRTINDIVAILKGGGYQKSFAPGAIAGLRQRPRDTGAVTTPFRLYRGSTWLKWCVGDGLFITDDDAVTPPEVNTEFTLTSGVVNWFWLDLTGVGEIVCDPTKPTWDAHHVPIGWVDTTNEEGEIAVPTQFCTTNIFSPCPPA